MMLVLSGLLVERVKVGRDWMHWFVVFLVDVGYIVFDRPFLKRSYFDVGRREYDQRPLMGKMVEVILGECPGDKLAGLECLLLMLSTLSSTSHFQNNKYRQLHKVYNKLHFNKSNDLIT